MREGLRRVVINGRVYHKRRINAQSRSLQVILETSRTALDDKRGRAHTSATYIGKHAEVVSNTIDCKVPLAVRSSSRQYFRIPQKVKFDKQPLERGIGHETNEDTQRH